MNYQEALDFLYSQLPMFQRIGAAAFKKDLSNTIALCEHLGHPERKFRSVHIAGTNGKGSTAHSLASICSSAGLKTGLYTSPHLRDFTERIRIDGQKMEQEAVATFVETHKEYILALKPSFFEITVAMAFDHFAKEAVDIAIIEVGMGGRLDSTNVITPDLCVITNIGYDHQQFLGDTLPEIAGEKAGIMKPGVPVIIGQRQPELDAVYQQKAEEVGATLIMATEHAAIRDAGADLQSRRFTIEQPAQWAGETWEIDLPGIYQLQNLPGILTAADQLTALGYPISKEAIKEGLAAVKQRSGLRGRWQQIGEEPLTICDTGHNTAAWEEIKKQLGQFEGRQLHLVIGMVNDKSIADVLRLFPKSAKYYFCAAKIPRALDAHALAQEAKDVAGLQGAVIPDVQEALSAARKAAGSDDVIFVGGSTFVVAEVEEIG